ncbi:MAG TPA: hypothetical protein VK009_09975 [Chloroflexota bacterium]|nr:hypothetical protein [Chloroflexota bacterium]
MKLPWATKSEEDDPYWDFFLNSAPADDRNSLLTAIRNAPDGVVNPVKEDIHTPEIMAQHTKELARYLGAEAVAIARTDRPDHPYAVLIGMRSDVDPRQAPGIGGQLAIQKGMYVVFILSAWIREMGYQGTAKIACDSSELAVRAGMGSLDSSGRVVSPTLGPLAIADAILTNLPLAVDG